MADSRFLKMTAKTVMIDTIHKKRVEKTLGERYLLVERNVSTSTSSSAVYSLFQSVKKT